MRIFLFILFFPVIVSGQNISRALQKANSLYFRNNIYVFGFVQDKSDLSFKLYKAASDLSSLDSVSNSLGKEKTESFLEVTSDTLHGYLNFYFHKSNNKNLATLLRYNDSLKMIAKVENFESNKINSLTSFENEIYTYKNSTYTIRTSEDSSGKQFFLTKYELISDKKIFEYKQSWQYPLEKRNINTARVLYADDNTLLMYVTILSGDRKGQWILKLNSRNGTIVKGIKLNSNGDERSYILSAFHFDVKNKQFLIAGNIYTKQQLDIETKNQAFTNLNKQNVFFFVRIDSAGGILSRDEKILPLVFATAAKPGSKPAAPNMYHIKIKEIHKKSDTQFEMYCIVYRSAPSSLLFLYESGFVLNATIEELGAEIESGKIHNILASFPNLVNNDLKDINGKIELKSLHEFDKFLIRKPVSEVENNYGLSGLNPKWIICKRDAKTGLNSFYDVRIGFKGVESKEILKSDKYNHPAVYKTNNHSLLLFSSDSSDFIFNLSLRNWP